MWIKNARARLVFLGACHSGTVPVGAGLTSLGGEIARSTGVPVVAMQGAVPREFATDFAVELYARLREGLDIEKAVYLARQVEHRGRHAFGIPVLYADLRAAEPDEMPERRLPEVGWAHFQRPYTTSPAQVARETWDGAGLTDDGRALVEEALETISKIRPAAEVPVPRSDATDAEVRVALTKLFGWLPGPSDTKAGNLVKALPPPRRGAPAPPAISVRVEGPVEPLDDRELGVGWAEVEPKLAHIAAAYALPRELLLRVVGELHAGRHVLFVGPVGTGKTTLAHKICEALGMRAHTATASADWTAFDIVGGFFPSTEGSGDDARTRMVFRSGQFTEAVLANWSEAPAAEGRRAWRRGAGGTWLVLDEMNRADMDRALGPVFTALEDRRLRVPSATFDEGAPPTVEIPVPRDFRVLATLNGVDRHYLFRISDALKRRFAFIEVPVTWDFAHEWDSLRGRCAGKLPAHGPAGDLRRFVYLARALHPVGTAQLFAAARFLGVCETSTLPDGVQLVQAVMGSVLPGLEDAPPPLLRLLEVWASGDPAQLAEALLAAIVDPAAPALVTLREALAKLPEDFMAAPLRSDTDTVRVLASWLARRAESARFPRAQAGRDAPRQRGLPCGRLTSAGGAAALSTPSRPSDRSRLPRGAARSR